MAETPETPALDDATLAEIRAAADAALAPRTCGSHRSMGSLLRCSECRLRQEANECLMRRLNPSVVLALLDRAEAAEARLAAVLALADIGSIPDGNNRCTSPLTDALFNVWAEMDETTGDYEAGQRLADAAMTVIRRAALAPDAAPSPGVEDGVGCGWCPEPFEISRDLGYTGSAAYHRECAREVYGDKFEETAPTPAAPTDEGARLGEGLSEEEVERLCEVMHDAYEAAAVEQGWETQERSRKPWADVPEANKATMRAAVRTVVLADRARGLGGDQQGEEAGR